MTGTLSDVAQRCRELIDIESVSRNEADVEAYIRAALPSAFAPTYEGDSVLLVNPGRRGRDHYVIFAGHTDTVPLQANWPSRVDGDLIYGRGGADMKAGLAVMIELARWIDTEHIEPGFDIGLLFFGREELAAQECPLLAALEDDAFQAATLAVIMEPTANAIEAGCMGNLNLTVRFAGVAAHSARPWQGENAISKGIMAMNELVQRKPVDVEISGLIFRDVASVTQVRGGVALNVVPALVEFDVNIRYAPTHAPETIETHWRNYFEDRGGAVQVLSNSAPAPVALDHPLVAQLQQAGATEVRPKQAWTNASDFAAHNIAAVNFGPGDPLYAHKQNEQVSARAIDESLATLKRFLSESSR